MCVFSDDAQLGASVMGLIVSSAAADAGEWRKGFNDGSVSLVVSIVIVGL
jgi:hypothetical protein